MGHLGNYSDPLFVWSPVTAAEDNFRKVAPPYMRKLMQDFPVGQEGAAAVFGNAGHESAGFTQMQELKPTIKNSAGGWGWFQWTGPRRRAMLAYCTRNGFDPKSHEANYKWLYVELKGSEAGAIPYMMAVAGLAEKTVAFERAFERAGIKHDDRRIKWAKIALDALRKAGDVPIPPGTDTPPVSRWSWIWATIAAFFTGE